MLVGMVEGYLDVKFEVGYRVGFGGKEMYFFVGVGGEKGDQKTRLTFGGGSQARRIWPVVEQKSEEIPPLRLRQGGKTMDGGRNAYILILFSIHHHNQFLTVRLYIFRLPSHRSSIPPSLLHPALSAELSTGMVGG